MLLFTCAWALSYQGDTNGSGDKSAREIIKMKEHLNTYRYGRN